MIGAFSTDSDNPDRTIEVAVGGARFRRRSCTNTRETNSTLNIAVGTAKKSECDELFRVRLEKCVPIAEDNLSPFGVFIAPIRREAIVEVNP